MRAIRPASLKPRAKKSTSVIERIDDIPDFSSEKEEADFWSTHQLGGELLEKMGPLDDVLPPPDASRRSE